MKREKNSMFIDTDTREGVSVFASQKIEGK